MIEFIFLRNFIFFEKHQLKQQKYFVSGEEQVTYLDIGRGLGTKNGTKIQKLKSGKQKPNGPLRQNLILLVFKLEVFRTYIRKKVLMGHLD